MDDNFNDVVEIPDDDIVESNVHIAASHTAYSANTEDDFMDIVSIPNDDFEDPGNY